jgi:hypothetical protein
MVALGIVVVVFETCLKPSMQVFLLKKIGFRDVGR